MEFLTLYLTLSLIILRLMTTLLMRVSGVALLEKTLKVEKPGYKEYVETTSAFIPWRPRKK